MTAVKFKIRHTLAFDGIHEGNHVFEHTYDWPDVPAEWFSNGALTGAGRAALLTRLYGQNWETDYDPPHYPAGYVRPAVLDLQIISITGCDR